ncbi:MAG: cysteine desulfurase family protein [Bacteroidetes bacterium]|nr:cysteine desulfurase family protein [Bacteroidota bacterium]
MNTLHTGAKPQTNQSIYMDHAATTPIAPTVFEAMLPYLRDHFGNPSSVHQLGRMAKGAVEDSRDRIAGHFEAKPEQIIFTSGATEANNLALNILGSDDHFITSKIEHKAILEPANQLASQGVPVTLLEADPLTGAVEASQIRESIRSDTRLISLMYVNNETGAMTDLKQISEICTDQGILLHTDAAQATAWLPLTPHAIGADMISISGHKIYGPKGIGILYIKEGIDLTPQILGGPQERERRGGTENVAAVVGMAAALEMIVNRRDGVSQRISSLREDLSDQLRSEMGDQIIINTPSRAAPHILNVAFKPVDDVPFDGEMLLLNLDIEGIYTSAGSACTSGAIVPSHVLLGLGLHEDTARASLRLSLGRSTSSAEIECTVDCITKVVQRMRGRRKHER